VLQIPPESLCIYVAHLRQECHNSKLLFFQEKCLKGLKCYTFLWMQWRHNCSPVASFTNCVMSLYLFKVHLQTFLSIPICQKCQILSCDTLVANERYAMDPNCAFIETQYIQVQKSPAKSDIWRWKWRLGSSWLSHRIVSYKVIPSNIQEDALSTAA
jgi:hypothetical protein